MTDNSPKEARASARVLLLNEQNQLLMMHAQMPEGHRFWMTPGGGVEADQTESTHLCLIPFFDSYHASWCRSQRRSNFF